MSHVKKRLYKKMLDGLNLARTAPSVNSEHRGFYAVSSILFS
ncbi:hypothetical protein MICA_657 [Micavibrio aeruginosavorus ARL-13]|uniref:Uncharacterized protein n=1 Tax=Micavibrio aeruginosavorus (strain ARL-13) TaxID=856793 RepID=G2KP90_MICAA|nr:hypothetical protein MICA_657 [Micavibrio aeruginosavorus ARL-13]